eukprot:3450733-Amphidinium_carterae.1
MESIMSDVQVQPWFQYEDDVTMFSEHAIKDAMDKELSQLINKKSFAEVDRRSLTAEQLQQVVATRWVITTRPSNNGTKDINCKFCGKGFSQFIHEARYRHSDLCSDTIINGNETFADNCDHQEVHSLHNRRCQCIPEHADQ